LLQRGDLNAMCATDIASYYPSIDLDRLETRLYDIGCDLHSVAVTLSGLRKFVAVDHIAGVPIGPEASGILGNAFLIPVDRMLMSLGAEHLRWMDDFKIMGRDTQACESIVGRFDQFLRTQGLTRADKKTDYYSDPPSAIAALRDDRLASLGSSLETWDDRAMDELRTAFDRQVRRVGEVSKSRFRFILRGLKNRCDDYAAAALAGDPDLQTSTRNCPASISRQLA
jgi:reverse transcriptase-like protein